MPDSISDEKVLKRSYEKNLLLVKNAEIKIRKAVVQIKNGKPPREGLGILRRAAGLPGQRLYFYSRTKHYTDKLKICQEKCIGCGLCEKSCPTGNIRVVDGAAAALTNALNRRLHYSGKRLLSSTTWISTFKTGGRMYCLIYPP